jgi:ankyrin repeat protein
MIGEGGLIAVDGLNESITTSQDASQRGHRRQSLSKKSARDYLSDRQSSSATDEKRVYRLITKSDLNKGQKLKEFLDAIQGRFDITSVVDRSGFTPLSYAIFKDKPWGAKWAENGGTGSQQVHSSLGAQSPRSVQTQSMTLTDWINLKNGRQSGMTAIHYAAFNGDMITIRELVANGANISQRNDTGMSALQFAAQGN